MQKLNCFVFYALQQCIFSPENKDAIIEKMNKKLSLMNNLQSEEVNALKNKINGLENAQRNLTDYLEAGKATQTILDKLQKNETELTILRTQLEAKSGEPVVVDEETYSRLVKRFTGYMSSVKTSETIALRDATIDHINVDTDDVTVFFKPGIYADDATVNYFNDYVEE